MFVVLLEFTPDRSRAAAAMAGHRAWIQRGVDDGVFAVVGSLATGGGGAIVAHGLTRAALEQRVGEDPFVVDGVVTPRIVEISPSVVDPRLEFLRP